MTNEISYLEAELLEHRNVNRTAGEPEEGPLSDIERAWLVSSNWVGQYAQGDADVADISGHLDSFRSGSGSQTPFTKTSGVKLTPTYRSLAFDEITAIDAARDPAVIAFRADVLDGRTIAFENIKAWMETSVEQGRPAAGEVTIPADAPQIPRNLDEAVELGIKAKWEFVYVEFPAPDGKHVERVKVPSEGVLYQLWKVARILERSYGWRKPLAVAFILAGQTPPPIRGWVSVSRYESLRPSTATITVNPEWVSPTQVARLYRDAMSQDIFKVRGGEPGAGRPLGEKSGRLAVFAARHAGSDSWAELMARWNAEHDDWNYTDRRQFGRDCRKSYARVTGQPLEARNAQGKG